MSIELKPMDSNRSKRNLSFISKVIFVGSYLISIEKFFILGKPLVFIQESKDYHRMYQCKIYSASPIIVKEFVLE